MYCYLVFFRETFTMSASGEENDTSSVSSENLPDPEQLARTNEAYYAILSQYCSPSSPRKRPHSPDVDDEHEPKKMCQESQTHILSLPPELLETIVGFLSYAEQSKIRLVGIRIIALTKNIYVFISHSMLHQLARMWNEHTVFCQRYMQR